MELRWLVKSLRTDLLVRDLRHKYRPSQPRVPSGNPDGGQWTSRGEQLHTSDDANADSMGLGAQQANVVPICLLGSHAISTDRFGNQSWWADYVCADGFTFRKFGTGDKVRGFWRDLR